THVGARFIPGEPLALRHRERPPLFRPGKDVRVLFLEQVAAKSACYRVSYLLGLRPDILEEHGLARWRPPQRSGFEIDIDASGERIGNDQRWAGQVVGTDQSVDSSFKVPVPAQDRTSDERL